MMTTVRALACGLLLISQTATAGPREPVAIIYRITGETLRIAPGRSPVPLRLFDRLPPGTALELASGSRLALAFVTGKRYEISGPARVTLGKGDLAMKSGGVRTLPSVSPLPPLAAIAEDENPGPTAGAVRIRGEEIENLYPSRGATALASAVVLRFESVEGAQRYWIEVEDGKGEIVYSTETSSTESILPADTLLPGVSYHWSVRTVDRPGPLAWGEADFVTLDAEMAEAVKALSTMKEDGLAPEN